MNRLIYIYIYIYIILYIYIYIYQPICLVSKVFANGLENQYSIQVIPKNQKIVLDSSLLNTQHYKVCIKGKVKQSRKRIMPLLHLSGVAIEKGTFRSPLDYSCQLIYIYMYIYIIQHKVCQW